jgi:hypothetical protein
MPLFAFRLCLAVFVLFTIHAQAQVNSQKWKLYKTGWTESDLNKYSEFVAAIGESQCRSINACFKGPQNPYRSTDRGDENFISDCADLPYTLLGYFAWKNGLPFGYSTEMQARGVNKRDVRYSTDGNTVLTRKNLTSKEIGRNSGAEILNRLVDSVSTAMFRTGPDMDLDHRGIAPDFYPVKISRTSIRPGTALYDPSGHVAVVYKVGADGRVHMMDAHPDQSITRIMFGEKFGNSRPAHGSGFKNFRPLVLQGAQRGADGSLLGGNIHSTANRNLPDFSSEQYLNKNWKAKKWQINNEALDFYSYTRIKLAHGKLQFHPVEEMRMMMRGLCSDFQDRVFSVQVAVQNGLDQKQNPDRLPVNIYGTSGEWEEYSTPSRDARLKTAALELRKNTERFVELLKKGDPRVIYKGDNIKADLLAAYEQEAQACTISYLNSRKETVQLSYDQLVARLFTMSFDPYHCPELRWGSPRETREFDTCKDSALDLEWYTAEQGLRNQIDRTYDAKMNFSLRDLQNRVPGSGPASSPDVNLRLYLKN